jgi:hypothetical protein
VVPLTHLAQGLGPESSLVETKDVDSEDCSEECEEHINFVGD